LGQYTLGTIYFPHPTTPPLDSFSSSSSNKYSLAKLGLRWIEHAAFHGHFSLAYHHLATLYDPCRPSLSPFDRHALLADENAKLIAEKQWKSFLRSSSPSSPSFSSSRDKIMQTHEQERSSSSVHPEPDTEADYLEDPILLPHLDKALSLYERGSYFGCGASSFTLGIFYSIGIDGITEGDGELAKAIHYMRLAAADKFDEAIAARATTWLKRNAPSSSSPDRPTSFRYR
jgi:TPR repeat protein